MVSKKVSRRLSEYKKVESLMKSAFPKHERLPFPLLMFLTLFKGYEFNAYYDGEDFVGFTYTIAKGNMVFLAFLAIDDGVRSKGYGSKILDALKKKYEESGIFLTMETVDQNADNYSQRLNRMRFYQRNGFYDTDYKVDDVKCSYSILSDKLPFNPESCKPILGRMASELAKAK